MILRVPLDRFSTVDQGYIETVLNQPSLLPQTDKPLRIWTSATGYQVQARLLSVSQDSVRLKRKDGKEIDVRMDQLDEDDVKYARKQAPQSAAPRTAPASPKHARGEGIAASWSIREVFTADMAPGGGGFQLTLNGGGGPSYLYVKLTFSNPPNGAALWQFRILDTHGKPCGEIYGQRAGRDALVIFKGNWASLNGLYLEGFGHRQSLASAPQR
jgi:hypothetical protein